MTENSEIICRGEKSPLFKALFASAEMRIAIGTNEKARLTRSRASEESGLDSAYRLVHSIGCFTVFRHVETFFFSLF
jgi:hypothetical protein